MLTVRERNTIGVTVAMVLHQMTGRTDIERRTVCQSHAAQSVGEFWVDMADARRDAVDAIITAQLEQAVAA